LADNPQETIRELKDLVIAYAKQETIDPLKGLGRYIGYGVGGAVLLGTGVFFLAMAGLRALQTQTGDTFADWRSFFPYFIVVIVLLAIAGIAFMLARKRGEQAGEQVTGEAASTTSTNSTDSTPSTATTPASTS
jgi:hypothetical protein